MPPLSDSDEEGEILDDEDSDDDEFEETGDGPCIELSKEEKRRIRHPWRKTLIVKGPQIS